MTLGSLPAGVIGGFIGSVVTAITGFLVERRRETTATTLRQQERRRDAYVELLAAGSAYFHGAVNEHVRSPSLPKPADALRAMTERIETARYVVEMVASAVVLPDARAYYESLMAIRLVNQRSNYSNEKFTNYLVEVEVMRYTFVNTARTELGEPVATTAEATVQALILDRGSVARADLPNEPGQSSPNGADRTG